MYEYILQPKQLPGRSHNIIGLLFVRSSPCTVVTTANHEINIQHLSLIRYSWVFCTKVDCRILWLYYLWYDVNSFWGMVVAKNCHLKWHILWCNACLAFSLVTHSQCG